MFMKFSHYQNKMKFQKFLKRITFVILLLPIISIMSQGQTSTKNAPDPHITECKVDNFLKFNSNSKSKYKNGIACWYKNDELKLEFTIQRSSGFGFCKCNSALFCAQYTSGDGKMDDLFKNKE